MFKDDSLQEIVLGSFEAFFGGKGMSILTSLTKKLRSYINNKSTSEVIATFPDDLGIIGIFASVSGDPGKGVGGISCDVRWQDCFQKSRYSSFIVHPPTP